MYISVMFHVKQVYKLLYSLACTYSFFISIGYGMLMKMALLSYLSAACRAV